MAAASGNGGEESGAGEIGGDEDGAAAQTVCPGSGEETEDKDAGAARSGEDSHLERRGIQDVGGGEGNADAGNGGTDFGDRLAAPQLEEIAVAAESSKKHLSSVTRRGFHSFRRKTHSRIECICVTR